MRRRFVLSLVLAGCVDHLEQVAGTGALYTTACSADMTPEADGTYTARCKPAACLNGYIEGPVNHRIVALDPGRKVVGIAERVCIQDLARASGLFQPAMFPPEATKVDGEPNDPPATQTPEPSPASEPDPNPTP